MIVAPAPVGFFHGVASGDAARDGVVIWTRLTIEPARSVELDWQVAEDEHFQSLIASGRAVTSPVGDHTVKVEVRGLRPGREY